MAAPLSGGSVRNLRDRRVEVQRFEVGSRAEQRGLEAFFSARPTFSAPAPRGPHIGEISRHQLLTYLSSWRGPQSPRPTGLWPWVD